MVFRIKKEEKNFFDLLPLDWQQSIVPHWQNIKQYATVYVLEVDKQICAGGIVFNSSIPDIENYLKEANFWFSKNYHYIGYVWVPLEKRNNNYGSLWVQHLFSENSKQNYWLTTEEKKLRHFYEKAGFTFVKHLYNNGLEEDLFVYEAISF